MIPTLEELGLDRRSPEDRLAVAEAIWEKSSGKWGLLRPPMLSERSWSVV